MTQKNKAVIRTGMKVGAVLGGLIFLIFGISLGFHFSGYGMLMVIGKILGGPVQFTLGLRILVTLGVLVGILLLGTLSIVIGSILGSISLYLVNAVSPLSAQEVE